MVFSSCWPVGFADSNQFILEYLGILGRNKIILLCGVSTSKAWYRWRVSEAILELFRRNMRTMHNSAPQIGLWDDCVHNPSVVHNLIQDQSVTEDHQDHERTLESCKMIKMQKRRSEASLVVFHSFSKRVKPNASSMKERGKLHVLPNCETCKLGIRWTHIDPYWSL